jgi:microcystin-dependent protein
VEPFLGQLMCVAFTYAPKGWAMCQGQLLQISQNTALFSLLGTTFGGDGRTTFALPDLRGRVANSSGQGPGLQNYNLGQVTGSESVTLTQQQMPLHQHVWSATQTAANATGDAGSVLADTAATAGLNVYKSNPQPNAVLNPATIGNYGGSQPHENRSPFLAQNWIIALQGIYPSRD